MSIVQSLVRLIFNIITTLQWEIYKLLYYTILKKIDKSLLKKKINSSSWYQSWVTQARISYIPNYIIYYTRISPAAILLKSN